MLAFCLTSKLQQCQTNIQDVSGKKKGEKKGQRSKKANKSKGGARKNNRKTNLPQGTNDLTAKLYNHMEKHKEVNLFVTCLFQWKYYLKTIKWLLTY